MYKTIDNQDISWLHEDNPQPGSNFSKMRTTPPISPSFNSNSADETKPSWLLSEDTPMRVDKKNKKVGSTRKSMVPILPSAKKPVSDVEGINHKAEDGYCCPSDPFLYWCRVLHFFAGLGAAVALFSNGYLLCIQKLDWRPIALHTYAVGFCVIMLGVELHITVLIEKLLILDFWIYKGLFYIFIGILTCKLCQLMFRQH